MNMQKEEFNYMKKMLELQTKFENLRHKYKMIELEFFRETERMIFDWKLQHQRIRSAEIKKAQQSIKLMKP